MDPLGRAYLRGELVRMPGSHTLDVDGNEAPTFRRRSGSESHDPQTLNPLLLPWLLLLALSVLESREDFDPSIRSGILDLKGTLMGLGFRI